MELHPTVLIMVTLLPVALEMITSLEPLPLTICLEDPGMMYFLVMPPPPPHRIKFTEERVMTYCTLRAVSQNCLVDQVMTYLKVVKQTPMVLTWTEAKATT